ncbi:MAG: tetratricopeptide repeat protein, partial [bacterium]|nr:tetratricopeptide repeat protein [bacterium]
KNEVTRHKTEAGTLFFSVYGSSYYTKAIEEYGKVITDYNESALCAVSQFQIGKCCFNLKNYSQAKIEFDKVIENYPDSKYVQQAKFYLIKIYNLN